MRESELGARYAQVREQIAQAERASGRSAGSVTLLAVSKYHAVEDMLALMKAGQYYFGENYVQEALGKRATLLAQAGSGRFELHMIGHVQTRKVPQILNAFALVHTLDSRKLADTFERRLAACGGVQPVLVEVNIAEEGQKTGLSAGDLPAFADFVLSGCPHLRLMGLMCMPPAGLGQSDARPYFARLRELREEVRLRTGLPLPHLSMGMSGDFVGAIAEGATIVRLGTAIFGPRPPRGEAQGL